MIGAATREHLVERFGPWVLGWCETLPARVEDLARRWRFRVVGPVSRGRNSCVLLCERDDGSATILKLTPDLSLGMAEALALTAWRDSDRVPRVFEFDDENGALLLEAIQPGTVLADDPSRIRLSEIAGLVRDLHASASEEATAEFPPLIERVEFMFAFWSGWLEKSEVASVVSLDLVEESQERARELASRPGPRVLLHGDLHPGNVLKGDRGLVAIDPRACIGDPAFDLIDWVLAGENDANAIARRAGWLSRKVGVDPNSLLQWSECTAVLVAIGKLFRGYDTGGVQPLLKLAASGRRRT